MAQTETIPQEIWCLISDQMELPHRRAMMRTCNVVHGAISARVARQIAEFAQEHCKTRKMRDMSLGDKLLLERLYFGLPMAKKVTNQKHHSREKIIRAYTGTLSRKLILSSAKRRQCIKYAAMGKQLARLSKIINRIDCGNEIPTGICLSDDIKYIENGPQIIRSVYPNYSESAEKAYWIDIIGVAIRRRKFNILQYCYTAHYQEMTQMKDDSDNFLNGNMEVARWAEEHDLLPPSGHDVYAGHHSSEFIQFLVNKGYKIDTEILSELSSTDLEDRKKFHLIMSSIDENFVFPGYTDTINYLEFDEDGSIFRAILAQVQKIGIRVYGQAGRPDLVEMAANILR